MHRVATRSPWCAGAAATAVLLPAAYSPSVYAPFWSPKLAVLVIVGAVGLTQLPRLLRSPLRRPTLAAAALLVVATASTLASGRPVEALFGTYNWGTGLLFIAALIGVWLLGATAAGEDRARTERLVVLGLLIGCGLSAGVGLLQSVVTVPLDVLDADGRATGLAGNAVHLGTIGCVGLAAAVAWTRRTYVALGAVAFFAAAVQVSATRSALVTAGVVVVTMGALWARRALPLLILALVAGVLLGNVLASNAGFETASSRGFDERTLAAASGGGIRVRLEVWSYARHAVLDRPVLGHGPGRFLAATAVDRTLPVVRAEGARATYSDAHNLLVQFAVTTGVLGALALCWFLASATRVARGPLVGVAAAVAALSLLQPQSVGTTPLLFLALGAASNAALPAPARRNRVALVAAGAVGTALAAALLVGDVSLLRARNTFDLDDARRADALLRPWPQPASVLADAHTFRAIDAPPGPERERERAEARRWRARAVDRYPRLASLWVALAEDEVADELLTDAADHFRTALELDPFALDAMLGLARIAAAEGDDETAISWYERALAIQPSPAIADALDQLR